MANPTLPFSRPRGVDALPDGGATVRIEATAAEREALAQADGLVALKRLEATFELKPRRSGEVRVTGTVQGVVTQTCTVSLDAFDSEVSEPVDLVFMPEAGVAAWVIKHKARLKDEPGLADEDPPDTIVDGRIDLGQVAAEFLALALDPYPRKPGVLFEADTSDDKDPSPFAALAGLAKND